MELIQRQRWIAGFRLQCDQAGYTWQESSPSRPTGSSRFLMIGQNRIEASRTILFLHGLGDDLLFPQMRLFHFLLSKGWSIATCDLDGHGAGTESSLYDARNILTVTADLIKFVESFIPGRPKLHLMGYSLGGLLQMHHAVSIPERVESLTLIGTPLQVPDVKFPVKEFLGLLNKEFLTSALELGLLASIPALGSFKRRQYPVRMSEGSSSFVQETKSLIDSLNLPLTLKLTHFPTLYLAGQHDQIANIKLAMESKRQASELQVYEVPGSCHFNVMYSSLCWKRIELFLRRC